MAKEMTITQQLITKLKNRAASTQKPADERIEQERAAYWQRLNSEVDEHIAAKEADQARRKEAAAHDQLFRQQALTGKYSKEVRNRVYGKYAERLKELIANTGKTYIKNPIQKQIIQAVLAVHMRDVDMCQQMSLNPKKGLFLSGIAGRGKTIILLALDVVGDLYSTSAEGICDKFDKGGSVGLDEIRKTPTLLVSELGMEAQKKHYGSEFKLSTLIDQRYNDWQAGLSRTYYDSNFSGEPEKGKKAGRNVYISTIYHPKTYSKIKESCNIITGFDMLPDFREIGKNHFTPTAS